uniref:Acyl-coenzyme A thioesterase 13 n=1 Tax=Xiphophorus maculatus TaxID=8083 RepID=A0A3B5QF24_XIPMA
MCATPETYTHHILLIFAFGFYCSTSLFQRKGLSEPYSTFNDEVADSPFLQVLNIRWNEFLQEYHIRGVSMQRDVLQVKKVDVVSASPGKVVCEMRVEEEHTNRGGTLHGGLTATLVDVISTMAIMHSERGAPGVSVDMNITYMNAANIGEDVLITAQVLKQGKTLAFATVDLSSKTSGKLIAQGRHTKHLGSS